MPSARIAAFDPQRYGFGFVNSFDRAFVLDTGTRLGKVSMGQNAGLCGGMTFATLDYYAAGRGAPDTLTDPVFDYLCERQQDSLDLPAGVFRYMNWQTTGDNTTTVAGWRVSDGISYATITTEWPKVRALLDAGFLAPLALVKVYSYDPRRLSENHQVLAFGYDLDEAAQFLTLNVYDPNYPRDGAITLRTGTGNPDLYRPIIHSAELGRPVRGFFLSNYVTAKSPPEPPPAP